MSSSSSSATTRGLLLLVSLLLLTVDPVAAFGGISVSTKSTTGATTTPSTTTTSFTIPSSSSTTTTSSTTSSTALWGKVKRGKLAANVVKDWSKKKSKQQPSQRSIKTTKTTQSPDISPALAQWAAAEGSTSSTTSTTTTTVVVPDDDDDSAAAAASLFETFQEEEEQPVAAAKVVDNKGRRGGRRPKNKKQSNKKTSGGGRREKQTARLAAQQAREEQLQAWVTDVQQVLNKETTNLAPLMLDRVQQLLASVNSDNLKVLLKGNRRRNFRLVWVGSDDALCHVGTGLHKVPLARLQDVFFSMVGRNRVVWQEVIRILGPFPNVKNTISGDASQLVNPQWTIVWDSLVDGVGKELLAGSEQNLRRVPLRVLFASETVLVAQTPNNNNNNDESLFDPDWTNNAGQNLLVWVEEPEMDEKLEKMRVA